MSTVVRNTTTESEGQSRSEVTRFLNREISWLEFNARVLDEAKDQRNPLLERANFLGIFDSNLDEFFMKRVGGLKRQIKAGVFYKSLDGLSAADQLKAIRQKLLPLLRTRDELYTGQMKAQLSDAGIAVLPWDRLNRAEKEYAQHYFEQNVFPLLTPLAVDSGHPFPFLSNLSSSIGVALAHPEYTEPLFARVKISGLTAEWIRLNPSASGAPFHFITLQDLVLQFIGTLFPSLNVLGVMPFRVTRNADIEVDIEEEDDLLDVVEEELQLRKFAEVVRLQHGPDPDPWILDFLMGQLGLSQRDVYEHDSELDFSGMRVLRSLPLPELKFPRWTPVAPPVFSEDGGIFETIAAADVLVHHPFESFSQSVDRFVQEAANDPAVRAIKMTVYRVGDRTPIMGHLIRAAENGKQVVCVVEIKARFDEERNIQWANTLEDAGVHVVYGIPGMKTHAKTILVVREEEHGVRMYAHFGTGNYHASTANLYTDLGLFTACPKNTRELAHLFNFLTGRSLKQDYQRLLVSPMTMETQFLQLIDAEREFARRGLPARIVAKMNALQARDVINALYAASADGVSIDLIVRGECCLRPGVPGLSENIRVYSILGRFLEHSRLFYFGQGTTRPEDGRYIISSADWMFRNLHRRVEVAVEIENRDLRKRCWEILAFCLEDTRQGWELRSDGSYGRRDLNSELPGSQVELMRRAAENAALFLYE